MNTTLVGVFKTASDARQAWHRLAVAGVSNTAIRLAVEEWPPEETAPAERGQTQQGRGAVQRFFLEMFDRVNEAAGAWFRPQLSDHFILTVVIADPQRVEQMGVILDDCGAVDIDEEAEAPASDRDMPAALGHLDARFERRLTSVGFGTDERLSR